MTSRHMSWAFVGYQKKVISINSVPTINSDNGYEPALHPFISMENIYGVTNKE